MAIRYAYDLYPRANPVAGARVVRFSQLQLAEYQGQANGTGSGKITLRGTSTDAAFIDPAGMQYIRVVRINTAVVDGGTLSGFSESVVGGFFLENGDYEALTENSTKKLTFGGAGTLSYLGRVVAAEQTYLAGSEGPFDDQWHWYFSPAGAILHRMVFEALDPDRPQSPISGVTLNFTEGLDSDGNAWPGYGTSWLFTAGVKEGLLSIVRRLMEAGVYVWMDPDTFELSAWMESAHGRDRTGLAWGANVVRFQTPTDGTIATGNIKSDARRGIGALIKRSDLLVGSAEGYAWVNDPAADLVWEGGYQVDDPTGTSLAQIGAAQLQARSDAGDTVRLRMMLASSPTTGKYLPFEDVQLDDRVTLHNGTGQWDWNEAEQKVAALSLKLRPGGDWDAWVDLGSLYSSIEERAFANQPVGAHTHPPNPRLCDIDAGFIETGGDWKLLNIFGSSEPAGWKDAGFDDSGWGFAEDSIGVSGLHMVHDPADPFRPSDVCIARKEYVVAQADLAGGSVVFKYAFDNAGTVWVNGVQVAQLTGSGSSNYTSNHATTLARSYFVAGLNVVAVRVENEAGGSLGNTPPGSYTGGVLIELPTGGLTGLSGRAARCDHGHLHRDISGRSAAGQHPAAAVTYNPAASGLTATEVQAALDELAAGGGAGTALSVGSLSNIATTGGYLAFPGIAKLDADHLVAVWRQGTDHATTVDGIIKYSIGTVAATGVVSWGSVTTLYDDASLDCRDPEVMVTAAGVVICSFFLWNGASAYGLRIAKATWDGAALSWGSPITVTTSYDANIVACSAKVVELFNGDLILPFYATAATNYVSALVRSTDGGATWGSQVTIVSGTVGAGNNWTEPYIALLPDGTLHCLIREDTDAQIYRTTSTDGGTTWATVAIAFAGKARPAHAWIQSGALLYVSRANTYGDTIYRISLDKGLTWSAETVLDSAGTVNEYASIVALDHYRYGVIYCIENSSTDADVKWTTFIDAATNVDLLDRLSSSLGVTDHGALTGLGDDDHTQYQRESEKAAASGYAGLDAGTKVPTAQLGSGSATSSTFLRGDQSWAAVSVVPTVHDEPLTDGASNFIFAVGDIVVVVGVPN